MNWASLEAEVGGFATATPFPHLVVDDFFEDATARALSEEFPAYDDPRWQEYSNAIEQKKTCNNWLAFPSLTYRVLADLNSPEFVTRLSKLFGGTLYADPGLNGGGWHVHGRGGKLNTHLDYSIHPKLGLLRKLNLIVYLAPEWSPEWGGGLGLWSHDVETDQPGTLVRNIAPKFNRAVLFDTTHNSWHGLPDPLTCPEGMLRKSLAVYYLTDPSALADPRGKALFAPTLEQRDDPEILRLIKLRSSSDTAAEAYRS